MSNCFRQKYEQSFSRIFPINSANTYNFRFRSFPFSFIFKKYVKLLYTYLSMNSQFHEFFNQFFGGFMQFGPTVWGRRGHRGWPFRGHSLPTFTRFSSLEYAWLGELQSSYWWQPDRFHCCLSSFCSIKKIRVRVRSRFFYQVWQQTHNASIGNK